MLTSIFLTSLFSVLLRVCQLLGLLDEMLFMLLFCLFENILILQLDGIVILGSAEVYISLILDGMSC